MTTSMLACGKANAFGSLRTHTAAIRRSYASAATAAKTAENGRHLPRAEDRDEQRELFVDVLNASATRREAKQYLARFKQEARPGDSKQVKMNAVWKTDRHAQSHGTKARLDRAGVNLGGLYAPPIAIAEAASFAQDEAAVHSEAIPRQLHVALVYLKSPEKLNDMTMDGLAVTLAQLVKLDMRLVIVLDTADHESLDDEDTVSQNFQTFQDSMAEQASRLSAAIGRHSPDEGRLVAGALEMVQPTELGEPSGDGFGARVSLPDLLMEPLKRGVVAIVPATAHTESGQLVRVTGLEVMTALTKKLAETQISSSSRDKASKLEAFLDRIIVLDDIGGIPSKTRDHGAHVFINLEQEFDDIEQELTEYGNQAVGSSPQHHAGMIYDRHRSNLEMTQHCLSLLPAASSAIIITPQEAASSSRKDQELTLGTGTRRRKNSLIYNLLTNKPMVSSSLPVARLSSASRIDGVPATTSNSAATLVKRGMPLTMIPATNRGMGWQRPKDGLSLLKLDADPRINLPRLVHLIEDSFRRKLNVQNYLDRIQGRIAGVIVAGDYEGGAILTWEMPSGTNDPSRLVPYLDKFAVLQSSQGSSGVADIVFQAMVRSCFPQGVCWRSRQDNPVNKWYLERSAGTWKIPHSNWTMFWTGEGIAEDEQRYNDYVNVCQNIQPSWADGKRPD